MTFKLPLSKGCPRALVKTAAKADAAMHSEIAMLHV